MGYSKGWARGVGRPSSAGVRPINPDHKNPQPDHPARNWTTAPASPNVMPVETIDNTAFSLDAAAGGLPWQPPGHNQGLGFGAGLSFAASSAQNDAARNTDDGSYLPRVWQPAVARDGQYHVHRQQLILDDAGLDHQAQVDLGKQLNRQAYPGRRAPGHRIYRTRDRVFERKTWAVSFRPIVTPNAYTAPPLSQLDDRTKYVSPYGDAVATNVRVVNTTAPQLRRTPHAWDQSVTKDGTTTNPWSGTEFQSWGI